MALGSGRALIKVVGWSMGFVARLIGIIFDRMKALGWLAQWTPAVAWVVEKVYDGDLKKDVYAVIVQEAAEKAGLALDKDDPFSDASMAGAVGARVGFPLRSLKDRAVIVEDIDKYVTGLVEGKTGYRVSSFVDPSGLKEDMLRIGAAELSSRLGLPVGVMPDDGGVFDPVAVKERLLIWARAELATQMDGNIQAVIAEIEASGDVLALANGLNSKLSQMGSVENVTARQIAVRVASAMATRSVVEYQQVAIMSTRRGRRQESLRRAQDKFRKKWGNRAQYIPVGWTANNPEPPPTV